LRIILWSRRYEGLEAKDNPELRTEKYTEAVVKATELLRLSEYDKNKYIEARISTRNALILIPGQPIEKLCEEGLRELDVCTLKGYEKGNLQGGLYNSWGAMLRLPDTAKAIKLLMTGLEVTESFTTTKGNLLNNLSDCYKNYAKDKSSSREEREENFFKALECLNSALEHYPKNEKRHIKGVNRKIKELEEEKEKFQQETQG
jgi:tetratricopeptide (TPR) repeat protein